MRIIAAALLAGLALQGAASADTIELKNGDKLEGVAILEQNDHVTIVEHPVLGRLEIPADDIKPPEEKKVKPGLFGTSFLRGWTKAVSAGFAGSSGVTKENNFNTDLGLNQETEHHRDSFTAKYYYADSDGDKTNNEFTMGELHDFLLADSSWFAFLAGGYKYDEFQLWDHRVTGSGGVGYDFLNDEVYRLSGRVGPGFTVTRGGSDDREDLNGVVAAEFRWAITEGVTFNSTAAYLPVLNDLPDFRTLGTAELKIAVGVIEGLSFKLGGSYEYDSQNADRNDRKYYGNLVYDF